MSLISHFTVIVFGDDVEGQLEPFNENTEVDPYRRYVSDDLYEHYCKLFKEDKGQEATSLEEVASFMNDKYGEDDERYDVDEQGLYTMSTYNPNSKWDWFQVGGRWRGYFKPKANVKGGVVGGPGTFGNGKKFEDGIDSAQLGQIDIEGMRDVAGKSEGEWWDRLHALVGDLPEIRPWSEFVAEIEATESDRDKQRPLIEKAREEYHAQPRVKLAEEHDLELRKQAQLLQDTDREKAEELYGQQVLGWDGAERMENYQRGRDACVERARLQAISSYAYVINGEWHAPGEMGWFGVSTDTPEDKDSYAVEFNKLLDELPPETQVTLVDAHI